MAVHGGSCIDMPRACRTRPDEVGTRMTPIDEAARILCAARRSGVQLDGLPEPLRIASVDDVHAVQMATARLLGDPIVGWKVATAPDGRLARGGLLRSRVYSDGATVPSALVPLLGVE